MKENVKIDKTLLSKVRARSKKIGMTMGGYVEMWLKHSFTPSYNLLDNSNAFHTWLDEKKIKYQQNGHFTTIETNDPIGIGMEWGIYKRENDPKYRKQPPFPTEVIDKY